MSLVNIVNELNQHTISKDNGQMLSNGVIDKFALFILDNCNCTLEQQQQRLLHTSCFELSDSVRDRVDAALEQINIEIAIAKGIAKDMETPKIR